MTTCGRSMTLPSSGLMVALPRHERLKRFALLPTEFSVENGELTPTLKVKRRVVTDRWGSVIEELFS